MSETDVERDMMPGLLQIPQPQQLRSHLIELLGTDVLPVIDDFIEEHFQLKRTENVRQATPEKGKRPTPTQKAANTSKKSVKPTPSSSKTSQRQSCDCQAQLHELINNCTSCGKIVCALEGPGPCLFCGTMIRPRHPRSGQNSASNTPKLHPKTRAQVVDGSLRSFSSKLVGGGGGGGGGSNVSSAFNSDNDDGDASSATRLAIERKDRLLEYQQAGQQRAHVIDQVSDHTLPSEAASANRWLSAEERAIQDAERKARLERLENESRRSGQARVISIDIAGKKIVESVVPAKPAAERDVATTRPSHDTSNNSSTRDGKVNRLFADNPLLDKKERLAYVPADERKSTNDGDMVARSNRRKRPTSQKSVEPTPPSASSSQTRLFKPLISLDYND